ncbi:DUF2806 domain-containing protein [Acetobacter senegalensis]|uniref:DUF2806 domain-containing protein n=1 Tax=Acetobacter senegalensis TaxID=446692 RepID=UPI0026513482|nr:DUF2806 domain-containing protein [Acetobacter senegalensis]MDN7352030.1 DUF2806 domain-containing protein [Acetobacter senegalensis]
MNDINGKIAGPLASASSGATALTLFLTGHPVAGVFSGLLTSKAVRESISRLVLGCAQVPEEWLKNQRKMIELKGEVERQPIKAFSEQAGKIITDSQPIKDRAELFALITLEKNQITRESIAQKTMEHLEEDGLPEDVSPPSEDFMRSFVEVAGKASSEELQDMMARILAGEIRQAGSISRATLSIADILDKNIIEAMVSIKPYIINKDWVCIDATELDVYWSSVSLLSSVRITTENGLRTINFNEEGYVAQSFENGAILLAGKKTHMPVMTDGFNITRSGKELFDILPSTEKIAMEIISKKYKQSNKFEKVLYGKIFEENGQQKFSGTEFNE